MSCKECEYSPKTYEEYCIGQTNPSIYCPDAYTKKSHLCGNYEDTPQESGEKWVNFAEELIPIIDESGSEDEKGW